MPQTTIPVLIIGAENDSLFPPPALEIQAARYLGSSDVSYELIPNTGHGFLYEASHPQMVDLVDQWLAQARRLRKREDRSMDEFATVDVDQGNPPPEKLQALFNDPEHARVQQLPCALEGLDSKAVHFPAGVRTNPHVHTKGQHIVVTDGVGVVGDESGVRVVHAGDVITSPPGGWHWHGALPTKSMSHVTVEDPGLELDVERRDYDEVYTEALGS